MSLLWSVALKGCTGKEFVPLGVFPKSLSTLVVKHESVDRSWKNCMGPTSITIATMLG